MTRQQLRQIWPLPDSPDSVDFAECLGVYRRSLEQCQGFRRAAFWRFLPGLLGLQILQIPMAGGEAHLVLQPRLVPHTAPVPPDPVLAAAPLLSFVVIVLGSQIAQVRYRQRLGQLATVTEKQADIRSS